MWPVYCVKACGLLLGLGMGRAYHHVKMQVFFYLLNKFGELLPDFPARERAQLIMLPALFYLGAFGSDAVFEHWLVRE